MEFLSQTGAIWNWGIPCWALQDVGTTARSDANLSCGLRYTIYSWLAFHKRWGPKGQQSQSGMSQSGTWGRQCHTVAPRAWGRRIQPSSWRCPTVRGFLEPTSRLCSMLGAHPSYNLHRRKKGNSWAQFPFFNTASCPRSKLKLPSCSWTIHCVDNLSVNGINASSTSQSWYMRGKILFKFWVTEIWKL